MNGWKFEINVPPVVYKDKIIDFKQRPPRLTESKQALEYRWKIQNEIEMLVESPFNCPVAVEMDLYMPTKRVSYPTSAGHMLARCLVPHLVGDQRLMRETTIRVHYNDNDAKDWKPRSIVTIYPIIGPQ